MLTQKQIEHFRHRRRVLMDEQYALVQTADSPPATLPEVEAFIAAHGVRRLPPGIAKGIGVDGKSGRKTLKRTSAPTKGIR